MRWDEAVRIQWFHVLQNSIQCATLRGLSGVATCMRRRWLVIAHRSWCVMSHASPAHVHPGAAGAGRDGALRGRGVQATQESAQGRLQTRRRSIGHSSPAAVAGYRFRTHAARICGRFCGGRSQRRGDLVQQRTPVRKSRNQPKTPRNGFVPNFSVLFTLPPICAGGLGSSPG